MKVTTKELRIQPGKIIEYAASGHEVTVTYRGRSMARIVPFENKETAESSTETILGLWKEHAESRDVDAYIRNIRQGRKF
ncbi:type II toxin-antitoxin system prevent-host-death family antitoxin [Methanococcoides sp. SA1]|nr:type II toxin-antitoxin system prevent-host-death family antitoxin [Methanococcoides sp. SA1]